MNDYNNDTKDKVINLKTGGILITGGSLTARVRGNLSNNHLLSAALLTSKCAPLERDYIWPANEEILLQHSTFARSAIILSVCSLEAAINEIQHDAIGRSENSLGNLFEYADRIEALWDTVERKPILRRFNWILTLAGLQKFDTGTKDYQAVSDLIALRNALVHWKPEWSDEAKASSDLEKRVSGKFPHNNLCTPDQLFIPYRCFGFGSGSWAVNSVIDFLVDFSNRINVQSKITNSIPKLKALTNIENFTNQ